MLKQGRDPHHPNVPVARKHELLFLTGAGPLVRVCAELFVLLCSGSQNDPEHRYTVHP